VTVLDLGGWDGPGSRAGSLYSTPPELRRDAARQLAAAGWWLHVDVLLTPDGPEGISVDALAEVRDELPDALVEVHLMEFGGQLSPVLDSFLELRPDRVVLPASRCGTDGPRVRDTGTQVWSEVHRGVLPDVEVDGLLLMLIDPGTRQDCDLDRLRATSTFPAGVPVGVDGGVRPPHLAPCLEAGVRHLISGRALLTRHS
jgi:hypothetical protein